MDRNFNTVQIKIVKMQSLSARRAWIEIGSAWVQEFPELYVALRKESVDRNGLGVCHYRDDVSSLSARRAWIEIANFCRNRFCPTVALRKESVDRNKESQSRFENNLKSLSARRAWIEILTDDVSTGGKIVALRKESVDRNDIRHATSPRPSVALRKESVDRNDIRIAPIDGIIGSLSARRAWIEITHQ